jgi:hypothetical protein
LVKLGDDAMNREKSIEIGFSPEEEALLYSVGVILPNCRSKRGHLVVPESEIASWLETTIEYLLHCGFDMQYAPTDQGMALEELSDKLRTALSYGKI